MIVSSQNGCGLCEIHHTLALGAVLGDAERAHRIALDYHLVQLSKREHALVELALKVTHTPKTITDEDFAALRAVGLKDEDILEAIETASWFNHTNRITISVGIVPDRKYFTGA